MVVTLKLHYLFARRLLSVPGTRVAHPGLVLAVTMRQSLLCILGLARQNNLRCLQFLGNVFRILPSWNRFMLPVLTDLLWRHSWKSISEGFIHDTSANSPLQNLAFCMVLQRVRCRTLHLARFCNGSVAEPCILHGSATGPLQNLAFGNVLQRVRCRTLHLARFCNGYVAEPCIRQGSATEPFPPKVHGYSCNRLQFKLL